MLLGLYRALRTSSYPFLTIFFLALSVCIAAVPIVYSTNTFKDIPGYIQKHLTARPNYIQASPYADESHLLDLNTLTKPHSLMAQGLTIMKPLSEKYALTAYKKAFNWQEVVDRVRNLAEAEDYIFPATSFYVIVFRSRINPTLHRPILWELDKEAHEEAVTSGWLLKYWYGTPDEEGYNLATCVWRHMDDAKKGGRGKAHNKAMRHVQGFYLKWDVERLSLAIGEGAKEWDIVDWFTGQPVESEYK